MTHPARALVTALLLVACAQEGEVDGAVLADGSEAALTTQQALAVSDDVLGFDPVLDRRRSAEDNAAALEENARTSMAGCGTTTRTGATLEVDFGTGCSLPSGHTVSGSIAVTVGVSTSAVVASLTYEALSIDGRTIDGSASFTTSDGAAYDVTLDLVGAAGSIDATLTIAASPGSFVTSGSATVVREGVSGTLGLDAVRWARGDCYPSAGTLTITIGPVTQTVAIDADTATTGVVTVTQGRFTTTDALPAYGDCPSA